AARAVMVERHPDGGALQALEAAAVVRVVGRARLPVEARGPRGGAGSGTSRRGGGSGHCGGQGGPQGERGGGRAGGGLLSSVGQHPGFLPEVRRGRLGPRVRAIPARIRTVPSNAASRGNRTPAACPPPGEEPDGGHAADQGSEGQGVTGVPTGRSLPGAAPAAFSCTAVGSGSFSSGTASQ